MPCDLSHVIGVSRRQAFTMTESEHDSLMDKVQNTEVRKGSQHACSNECACRDPNHIYISHTNDLFSNAFHFLTHMADMMHVQFLSEQKEALRLLK